MLINKSNYELFALDYIEGNLDARTRKAMIAFLQAHPDLEAEIESMQAAMFSFEADESIVYENKASLLKEENETPVVFMQPRRWYQMAAAAAVAILLIGFGVGYFAGSVSSMEEGMMVEVTDKIENQAPITSPVIEEETIAKVSETTDNEIIEPVNPTKTKEKRVEKPLILQESATPALVAMEAEIIEPIQPISTEIEPIVEELKTDRRAEVIAVTPLPRVEVTITINSIQSVNESSILSNSNSKDWIANLNADNRLGNKFSKIKDFIGKLPFEDATLDAFVPTYFANADSD